MAREVWVIESSFLEGPWSPIATEFSLPAAVDAKAKLGKDHPDRLRTSRVARYVPEDEK